MNALALQQPAQLLARSNGGQVALAGGVMTVVLSVAVGSLLLAIGALVSVLRTQLGGGVNFICVVVDFVAPFLGNLAWFDIGRRDTESRSTA